MANSASHPYGVGEMSSDPLMMDYEGGDLLAGWRCLSVADYWVTACVCRLGGDLNSGLAAQFQ